MKPQNYHTEYLILYKGDIIGNGRAGMRVENPASHASIIQARDNLLAAVRRLEAKSNPCRHPDNIQIHIGAMVPYEFSLGDQPADQENQPTLGGCMTGKP